MVSTPLPSAREVDEAKAVWDRPAILAEVRRRGSSYRQLAIANGFKPSTVQASLYHRHPKAHTILAAFLGVSRHEIWPHWYGPDDELLPLQPKREAA